MRLKAKLILVSSFVLLFILTMPIVGAKNDDEEYGTGTFGGNAIGFSASFMAVACSAVAVAELTVYPQTFWPLNLLSLFLLAISFSLSGGTRGPIFWVATFSTLIVAIIMVATVFSRNVVKKVVWG